MSIDLDTHKASRPQSKPKPELPPIVRDYLEHVRGAPEMFERLLPDYLDRLWAQAIDFATKNAVTCPVHREEIDALRSVIEDRVISEAVLHSGESAPACGAKARPIATKTQQGSFKKRCDLLRRKAPEKKRRLWALPTLRSVHAVENRQSFGGAAKDRSITSTLHKGKKIAKFANRNDKGRSLSATRAQRFPLRPMTCCDAPPRRLGGPLR